MSDHRASLIRLYDTVFDRAPDAGGLEYWTGVMGQGHPLSAIAGGFMQAPEFAATYGQPTNLSFVESLYENILDRPGEEGGMAHWTAVLDEGRGLREHIVVAFSDSPEHIAQMAQALAPAAPPLMAFAPAPVPLPDGPAHFTGSMHGEAIEGHAGHRNTIRGNEGNDTLFGGALADTLYGGDGDDVLYGRAGDDYLEGNDGDDQLEGGDGADVLRGNRGNDTLCGGAGADSMSSGDEWGGVQSRTVFRFYEVAQADGDVISGFQNGFDLLEFRAIRLEADQMRFEVDASPETYARTKGGAVSTVFLDADRDGSADATMTVIGDVLTASSFLL